MHAEVDLNAAGVTSSATTHVEVSGGSGLRFSPAHAHCSMSAGIATTASINPKLRPPAGTHADTSNVPSRTDALPNPPLNPAPCPSHPPAWSCAACAPSYAAPSGMAGSPPRSTAPKCRPHSCTWRHTAAMGFGVQGLEQWQRRTKICVVCLIFVFVWVTEFTARSDGTKLVRHQSKAATCGHDHDATYSKAVSCVYMLFMCVHV